ncbi:MAG: 16S rRNA (guanine(527)-N(7))-methyltransferase RsmG [Candidatus Kapaibacterium sp.]
MDLTEFWTLCSSNEIILEYEQLVQIERFHDEVIYWNSKVNLISRQDEERLLENHILHCLAILKHLNIPQKSWCADIGTGGGFPGIPLTIARPDLRMFLIDSIAKKVKITALLAKHTGIRNISAVRARAEEYMREKENLKKFDFIFARAVARTEKLVGWIRPGIKKDGKIVLLKGGDLDEEIKEASEKYDMFSFTLKPLNLFGYDNFVKEDKKIIIAEYKNNK